MASVSTKVEVQGAKQFSNDFKESARAVKSASAELKFFSNELNRNGASADALKNKLNSLNKAFDSEGDAIAKLESRLKVLADNGAENTDEWVKWTTELYKHRDAQAQIQSEIQDTVNELDKLENGADEAGNEVDDLGSKAKSAGNQIGDSFAQDIAKATVFMTKLVDVAIEVAKAVWNVGKGAVQYNAQMGSYSRTIEAFFKTSGQGAEEASKNTADLIANQKELSAQIGIGADKLIDANKMLIASGVNGDRSQKAISSLAKAIVATGGGNEELSRMAQNLQQISNTGKASTQDMKQFAMAGVDVYGLLADSTGKTIEQLKEMDITFDMIVDALDKATQEGGKFFEASQVGASTLNGQMSLLSSTVQEGLGTAFQPINDVLREKLIPAATDFVENIDWQKVGEGMASVAEALANTLSTIQELKDWYVSIYGEPAQETIDAFSSSNEELKNSFYETLGAVNLIDPSMAGAVEAVKGHGNHMVMEFDGMKEGVTKSVQETAGEVKNELIDMGWEMLQQGETDARQLGQGIANGSISAETETKTMMDSIMAEVDKRSQAEQYGADFVSGFATGMHRNNGLVANAASALASTISRILHFSRPDEGPLRDYETWMPHFIEGLAASMRANEWRLANATQDLASAVSNTYNNNVTFNITQREGESGTALARRINRQLGEVY